MFWLRNKKINFLLHARCFIMEKIEGTVTVGKTIGFERMIVNYFLPISLNICFGCPREPSH